MTNLIIKSIQTGSVLIAAGSSSATATLGTAVTVANAVVIFNGFTSPNSSSFNAAFSYAGLTLTNTTTVTAQTGAIDTTYARTVNFTVLEFVAGVLKTNQPNTLAVTTSSGTKTLTTSVTKANSFVVPQGSTYSPSSDSFASTLIGTVGQLTLTNTNTVTASLNFINSGATNTFYFTVLEFQTGFINSIQEGTIGIVDPATSNTATITSVVPGNSIAFFMGYWINDYTISTNTWEPYIVLTNATTVTANIVASAGFSPAETTNVGYTIVEFVAATVKSKQSGITAITSGNTTATATLSAVSTANAFLNFCNWNDTNSSDNGNTTKCYPSGVLTNGTTATFSVGGSVASGQISVAWEVIEFLFNTAITTDNSLRLEALEAVKADSIIRDENFNTILTTRPTNKFETVGNLRLDNSLFSEWIAFGKFDTSIRGEFMEIAGLDRVSPFEFTGINIIINNGLIRLESLARAGRDYVSPLELNLLVRTDTPAIADNIATIRPDAVMRLEFIGSQMGDLLMRLESNSKAASDILMVGETLMSNIVNTLISEEMLASRGYDAAARTEWIGGITIDSPLQVDWAIGVIRSDSSTPLESEFSLPYIDRPVLLEAIASYVNNQSMRVDSLMGTLNRGSTPSESTAVTRVDLTLPSEFVAKISSDITGRYEEIATLTINQIIPMETVTQAIKSEYLTPHEFLMVARNDIVGLIEASITNRGPGSAPSEFVSTGVRDILIREEVLFNAGKHNLATLEVLSNALNNFTNNNMPFEIVVLVKNDARIPDESHQSVAMNAQAFQDYIASITKDNGLNVEWRLRFVPGTASNRVFKVIATIE